jgi:hypothetical protein
MSVRCPSEEGRRKKEEGRSNRPHRESAIKNILTLRAVAILIKSSALKK